MKRAKGNPTINTIWKVANGLGVDYSQLIAPPAASVQIVREADIPIQADDDGLFATRCYFPATSTRRFDVFTVTIMPGEEHLSEGHSPNTQEYVLVQQGTLEAYIASEAYVLNQGDAMCFDCTRPHKFCNPGTKPVSFLDIIYYQ